MNGSQTDVLVRHGLSSEQLLHYLLLDGLALCMPRFLRRQLCENIEEQGCNRGLLGCQRRYCDPKTVNIITPESRNSFFDDLVRASLLRPMTYAANVHTCDSNQTLAKRLYTKRCECSPPKNVDLIGVKTSPNSLEAI